MKDYDVVPSHETKDENHFLHLLLSFTPLLPYLPQIRCPAVL